MSNSIQLEQEFSKAVDTAIKSFVDNSSYELEVRFGVFENGSFKPFFRKELFIKLVEVMKQDNRFVYNEAVETIERHAQGISFNVTTGEYRQKNRISILDNNDYNFRIALSDEQPIENPKTVTTPILNTFVKTRYSFEYQSKGIRYDFTKVDTVSGHSYSLELELVRGSVSKDYFKTLFENIEFVVKVSSKEKYLTKNSFKFGVMDELYKSLKIKDLRQIGSQPEAFTLESLVNRDYPKAGTGVAITPKIDGLRMFLFVNVFGNCVLVSPNGQYILLTDYNSQNFKGSLFDCEYLDNGTVYIFDTIFYNTFSMAGIHPQLGNKRFLLEDRTKIYTDFVNTLGYPGNPKLLFKFIAKPYFTKDIKTVLNSTEYTPNDGWILTPIDLVYPETRKSPLWKKWKPVEKITMDFIVIDNVPYCSGPKNTKVEFVYVPKNKTSFNFVGFDNLATTDLRVLFDPKTFTFTANASQSPTGVLSSSAWLRFVMVSNKPNEHHFNLRWSNGQLYTGDDVSVNTLLPSVVFDGNIARFKVQNPNGVNYSPTDIVECSFNGTTFDILKVRYDKSTPNYIDVAISNFNSVVYPITANDIVLFIADINEIITTQNNEMDIDIPVVTDPFMMLLKYLSPDLGVQSIDRYTANKNVSSKTVYIGSLGLFTDDLSLSMEKLKKPLYFLELNTADIYRQLIHSASKTLTFGPKTSIKANFSNTEPNVSFVPNGIELTVTVSYPENEDFSVKLLREADLAQLDPNNFTVRYTNISNFLIRPDIPMEMRKFLGNFKLIRVIPNSTHLDLRHSISTDLKEIDIKGHIFMYNDVFKLDQSYQEDTLVFAYHTNFMKSKQSLIDFITAIRDKPYKTIVFVSNTEEAIEQGIKKSAANSIPFDKFQDTIRNAFFDIETNPADTTNFGKQYTWYNPFGKALALYRIPLAVEKVLYNGIERNGYTNKKQFKIASNPNAIVTVFSKV
jgi:hypothetical protein